LLLLPEAELKIPALLMLIVPCEPEEAEGVTCKLLPKAYCCPPVKAKS